MKKSTDLLCLGEPLVEFNELPDGSFKVGFGGDVSNVAISASRAGASAGMITHVGDDLFGQKLVDLWDREKVDQTCVKIHRGADTGLYFVTHDEDGHHFHYRRKNSAASRLGVDDLPLDQIAKSQIFYASGISLAVGNNMRGACLAALQVARAAEVQCAFDPNLRLTLWPLDQARSITHAAMKHCDIALPGFDDAKLLTGKDSPEGIINFYHGLDARIVALTLGKDGVILSFDGQTHTIKPHSVEAVDATGAGDCFNGVFLSEIMRTNNPVTAATNANLAAAKSTTRFGAV